MLTGMAGQIEALRDRPAGTPKGVAVIAHPHPLFGGTMDNKVVQTLARAFVQTGWEAIRFNFRGVGASEGVHDAGKGEAQDLLEVVRQVAPQGPLALAGFSFGAFVTTHAVAALWEPAVWKRWCWWAPLPAALSQRLCRQRRMHARWCCMVKRMTPCHCSP